MPWSRRQAQLVGPIRVGEGRDPGCRPDLCERGSARHPPRNRVGPSGWRGGASTSEYGSALALQVPDVTAVLHVRRLSRKKDRTAPTVIQHTFVVTPTGSAPWSCAASMRPSRATPGRVFLSCERRTTPPTDDTRPRPVSPVPVTAFSGGHPGRPSTLAQRRGVPPTVALRAQKGALR